MKFGGNLVGASTIFLFLNKTGVGSRTLVWVGDFGPTTL